MKFIEFFKLTTYVKGFIHFMTKRKLSAEKMDIQYTILQVDQSKSPYIDKHLKNNHHHFIVQKKPLPLMIEEYINPQQ